MKTKNESKSLESIFVDLINSSELNKMQIRLYMYLYINSQEALSKGELYAPSQENLGKILGHHQPQISTGLKKLSEIGLIDYKDFRHNGVKICIPVKPESAIKILQVH